MAELKLEHLRKVYDSGNLAVEDFKNRIEKFKISA